MVKSIWFRLDQLPGKKGERSNAEPPDKVVAISASFVLKASHNWIVVKALLPVELKALC